MISNESIETDKMVTSPRRNKRRNQFSTVGSPSLKSPYQKKIRQLRWTEAEKCYIKKYVREGNSIDLKACSEEINSVFGNKRSVKSCQSAIKRLSFQHGACNRSDGKVDVSVQTEVTLDSRDNVQWYTGGDKARIETVCGKQSVLRQLLGVDAAGTKVSKTASEKNSTSGSSGTGNKAIGLNNCLGSDHQYARQEHCESAMWGIKNAEIENSQLNLADISKIQKSLQEPYVSNLIETLMSMPVLRHNMLNILGKSSEFKLFN